MLFGPSAFYTILSTVRVANVAALNAQGTPITTSVVVPGAIAWDECDTCGLHALAVTRRFLSDEFPIEVSTSTYPAPGAILCADFVVQIIRCAPQPQGNALAPDPAALDASAQEVDADAWAIMCSTIEALTALKAAGDIEEFLIRQQVSAGPEGACVGSELQVVVGVMR